MKKPIITMVHTVFPIIEPLKKLFAEKTPVGAVQIFNIVDDSIIPRMVEDGINPGVIRSLYSHLQAAEDLGSDLILVTCSSITEIVDTVKPFFSVPLIKIDDRMTDEAVKAGKRIGVVATVETTLQPTINQLRKKSELAGKEIIVESALCSKAYNSLMKDGDREKHDAIIMTEIEGLISKVDAIVLAQASLAHLEPKLTQKTGKKVFSSPESAVEKVVGMLNLNEE